MKRTLPLGRNTKSADAIDQHVGNRVRAQRLLRGMSQEKLGDALGLTFQQVQKYEKGTNRIGASRLSHIAAILGVPISFFYEGAPVPRQSGFADVSTLSGIADFLATKEGLHLMTSFLKISDEAVRRQLVALITAISAAETPARKRPTRSARHARSAEMTLRN